MNVKTNKDFIMNFLLIIIGNSLFALITEIVITFLRIGNGSTNKMQYSSLESFLIFINVVSFVLFFSHLIYESYIKKDETYNNNNIQEYNNEEKNIDSSASSTIPNNNIFDASNVKNDKTLFGKIEESTEILSLNSLDENVRQAIIQEQIINTNTTSEQDFVPVDNIEPEPERINNDNDDIDNIINNIESNTDYQNYDNSAMW